MEINLKIRDIELLDLKDDFTMNEEYEFYEFLNEDPVSAFYLGVNINDWFPLLTSKQKYLHSTHIRHNFDYVEPYVSQLEFWKNKYEKLNDIKPNQMVDMIEINEYLLNNMILDPETESRDLVDIAFYLGHLIANDKLEKDEKSSNIH